MEKKVFDCLIVGAGAAGLLAALDLASAGLSVAVVEAKERTGGRMFTIVEGGYRMELGAEFIHGDLRLTKELLQQAGAKLHPVAGSLWQHKNGSLQQQDDFVEDSNQLFEKCRQLKEDKPVSLFLQEDLAGPEYDELRFSLKSYIEGYDAADTTKASAKALCHDSSQEEEEQFRIEGGYGVLVRYLEQQGRNYGVQFYLGEPVQQLVWRTNEVSVVTEQHTYQAAKALITVSIGVLQSDAITFSPALPTVKAAAQQLGFGHVVKIVLRFRSAFWKETGLLKHDRLADFGFLFSREEIPTWWTQFPQEEPVLTGWLGGPDAKILQQLPKEVLVKKALRSLSEIFGIDTGYLEKEVVATGYYNWLNDPTICGAYSYEVVNGEAAVAVLKQSVSDTIFFAGEGLHQGPKAGTVEAALIEGRAAAKRLLATFLTR